MPTLQQVHDFVDTRLTNFFTNQIVPRENAYFATRGRYFQGVIVVGLDSLPDNPNDGNNTVLATAFSATVRPTDQIETWADLGFNFGGATVPMAIQIDTYDGPGGKGYVVTVYVRWDGKFYSHSQNVGPETFRTTPWRRFFRSRDGDSLAPTSQVGLMSEPAPGRMAAAWSSIKTFFGMA